VWSSVIMAALLGLPRRRVKINATQRMARSSALI
jgi:hypothetical protein